VLIKEEKSLEEEDYFPNENIACIELVWFDEMTNQYLTRV